MPTPKGIDTEAVIAISQIDPHSAAFTPALAGKREGKLVRNCVSSQGSPSRETAANSTANSTTLTAVADMMNARKPFATR